MGCEERRLSNERGEIASWPIVLVMLVLAAAYAATELGDPLENVADDVAAAFDGTPGSGPMAASNIPGAVVLLDGTTRLPDGTLQLPDGIVHLADGTVQLPDGTTLLLDGTVLLADGTVQLPDGTTVFPDGAVEMPDGTTVFPDGTIHLPDGTVTHPDGSVHFPDGTVVLADGTTHFPDGTIILDDGTIQHPDGTIEFPDGTIVKPNGTVILPDGTYVVPQQDIPPRLQDVLDVIVEKIDKGDDLGMSNGELKTVIEILNALDAADREAIIAALSDEQLRRLFHNVDSSSIWSNDLSDKDRTGFYTLLGQLSFDQQQRLEPHTDWFELYDSELTPLNVDIPQDEFVTNYETILDLDLDEFLALRAHMWDNPELIADSPFDWYADGCSIPGGQYPGYMNGPCLLHDFAYRNARVAKENYGPKYGDVDAGGIAEEWKNHADRRLLTDIADREPAGGLAGVVYLGVAVDWWVVPNGKDAFEMEYETFYGPGYDPNLGQWPDEQSDSDLMDDLVDLATAGDQP